MVPSLILGVIGRDVRRRVAEYLTGEPEIHLMNTAIHITARTTHQSPPLGELSFSIKLDKYE